MMTDRNGHQNAKTHFEKTDLRQPVIRGVFGVGKWFVPRKTIRKKLLKCKVNVNLGYMIKAKIFSKTFLEIKRNWCLERWED